LEKEIPVRMPMLHSVAHDMRSTRNHIANDAIVNQGARLLVCKANPQALCSGQIAQLRALLQGQHQWFFGKGVFSGLKDGTRHRGMRVWDGQVNHDVDVICGQQILDRFTPNAKFFGARLGHIKVNVRNGPDLKRLEQRRKFKIRGRNITASDDADTKRFMVFFTLILRRRWRGGQSVREHFGCHAP
jgi:hypothetical protein